MLVRIFVRTKRRFPPLYTTSRQRLFVGQMKGLWAEYDRSGRPICLICLHGEHKLEQEKAIVTQCAIAGKGYLGSSGGNSTAEIG